MPTDPAYGDIDTYLQRYRAESYAAWDGVVLPKENDES